MPRTYKYPDNLTSKQCDVLHLVSIEAGTDRYAVRPRSRLKAVK